MDTSMHNSLLFHQTFLKGKPKALGIVLIVSGVLEVALGIASVYTGAIYSWASGIDFWGAVVYIIAGALTIVAGTNPNICMIKGSLAMNIITAIVSFIAFILVCADLALFNAITYYADGTLKEYLSSAKAVLALLLILNLLLFSVSISLSVFGCQAVGHESNTPAQVFVVQNTVVTGMPQPPPYPIS
ncbi:membrane-spanning 4-domains subfamily A member 15-like [Rana temporaria]|uniref:membrane-spanning 4-domains subfamily A member 15-like n=1 Tax=Rana temporaria TaxID=8407 RepID=UPI001AAD6FEF|nr:membrane-spanning 4-domains subfamily A member 15-like [Rana temporaria]